MSSLNFAVKITAVGEVRDKDGNLLSATPVEFTQIMDADEVRAFTEGTGE
jgi:hypothetical protein